LSPGGAQRTTEPIAADGGRFAGQAEFVEYGVHEVAGAVACERAAGSVGPVSSRSEAEDEDAGVGIAESGNGFGPVFLVAIGFATGLADAANIGDEASATGAIGNVLLDSRKGREGRLWIGPQRAHGRFFLENG
jgi:hypothetical protein